MRECICPVVDIQAKRGQITEEQQRHIATLLCAQVTLAATDYRGPGSIVVVFGKHRSDCPCSVVKAEMD